MTEIKRHFDALEFESRCCSAGGAGGVVAAVLAATATCTPGETVAIVQLDICGETVDEVCNAIGLPAENGSQVIIGRQPECYTNKACGSTVPWMLIAVRPVPFCPVVKVEAQEHCLVEHHAKFYGFVCEQDAHARKIADLTDCEEGSGSDQSGSDQSGSCDLDSTWSTGCAQ